MNKYTREHVRKHNIEKNAWIIIDNNVYNITKFIFNHPGGDKVLLDLLGDDAIEDFYMNHSNYKIGEIEI